MFRLANQIIYFKRESRVDTNISEVMELNIKAFC